MQRGTSNALGGCAVLLLGVAGELAITAAVIYGIVKIVRLAWGS